MKGSIGICDQQSTQSYGSIHGQRLIRAMLPIPWPRLVSRDPRSIASKHTLQSPIDLARARCKEISLFSALPRLAQLHVFFPSVDEESSKPANLPLIQDGQQSHQALHILWSLGIGPIGSRIVLAKARVAIWDRIIQSSQQLVILHDFDEPLGVDLPHDPASSVCRI